MRRRVYGPDNLHTLDAEERLANARGFRGSNAEDQRKALATLRRVYVLRVQNQGREAEKTRETSAHLGVMLIMQGLPQQAEALMRESWPACQRVFGPMHLESCKAAVTLFDALFFQHKFKEAREHYAQILPPIRRTLGPAHYLTPYLENDGRTKMSHHEGEVVCARVAKH